MRRPRGYVETRFVLGLGGFGAGALDQPEAGTPADDEQREDTAGDNDEGQLYTAAREHPERHSSDDGAQPDRDPRR